MKFEVWNDNSPPEGVTRFRLVEEDDSVSVQIVNITIHTPNTMIWCTGLNKRIICIILLLVNVHV